ncbi:intermembrane transport protein PqiB [Desulfosarcina variabilis]|uniref:PqiB family protein n=1 Tax=Desulfosarcina variabilis TaxID=2300 RepID=UPI003AFACC7D
MMNEPSTESGLVQSASEPEIQSRKRFSVIWLIPMIAALIGIWLAVKAIRETGPTITIVFRSAEGLVAGKTEIKYKDVTVGKVETIKLSEDLSQVWVTAAMSPDVAGHLSQDTQFWIVRARVAVGEVSGISTLLSGAYIGMSPGTNGKIVYRFQGQEKPPAISREIEGQQFTLRAEQLGSLDIGSPVYFRQLKVGRVTNVAMAEDGSGVMLEIFIEAPYNDKVKRSSRFYNASGLDLKIEADGVRLDTPSLASFLVGGISFFTSGDLRTSPPVSENHIFTLYDNRDAANAASFSYREYYLLYFDETVRGLSPGAPVEFHGIRIGEVISVRLLFDQDNLNFRIPVLIAIEPDRIELSGKLAISENTVLEKLVQKGLRAQQRTGNLLTGQSYVCLNFIEGTSSQQINYDDVYPVLPTIPNAMEEIAATAKKMVERFNKLPLEETLADIRSAALQVKAMTGSKSLESAISNIDQSFARFKQVAADFDEQTLVRIDELLARGDELLITANSVLGEGAPAVYNLNRLLIELQDAARAVEALADYLERHPNAIVFGKGNQE